MYICSQCNREFKSQWALYAHKRAHLTTPRNPNDVNQMVKATKDRHKIRVKKYKKNPTRCKLCNKPFPYKRRKCKFCNSSHAATYNNSKRKNDWSKRRSIIELWIEEKLKKDYPNLKILFNDKETIQFELDILIPDLRLAFEINGIVHYEPIYDEKTFNKIQQNDKQKIIRCYNKGIELVTVDISWCSYFKESNCEKIYKPIQNIIEKVYGRLGKL